MRTTAQEESARIVQRGDEQLTVQRQQVVRELRGEIGSLAVQLAGRVVGESLADDPGRQRTVDRFLDDLDGMAGRCRPVRAGGPAGGGGPRARRPGASSDAAAAATATAASGGRVDVRWPVAGAASRESLAAARRPGRST